MNALSILQNAGSDDVRSAPYPHVIIEDALPARLYQDLADGRPTTDQILYGRNPGSNLRYDLTAPELLVLADDGDWPAGAWRAFIAHHTGAAFWHEILDLFEPSIMALHGDAISQGGVTLRDMSVGMRGDAGSMVALDCQVGLNTTVLAPGRVRGPHIDNPKKLFTLMFYMRDPADDSRGGEFAIDAVDRRDEELRFYGKAQLRDETVERAATVRYAPNTACAFINSVRSVHEVTPRSVTAFPRLLVNLVAELKLALFSYQREA